MRMVLLQCMLRGGTITNEAYDIKHTRRGDLIPKEARYTIEELIQSNTLHLKKVQMHTLVELSQSISNTVQNA